MNVDTLDAIVSKASSLWPRREALVDEQGRATTYRALEEMTDIVAGKLVSMGLSFAGRVAILSRNSAWSAAAYFGVLRAGGIAVYLNYSLHAKELVSLVMDSRPSILIYEKEHEGKAHAITGQTALKSFVLDTLASDHGGRGADVRIKPDNLAAIVYTSGSTSRSLGVELTHRNLVSNTAAIVNYMKLGESDRICCVLPFYYIYGLSLMLSHFMAGGTVLMDGRFLYPQIVLDAIEEKGATGFAGVSSHYTILMNTTNFFEKSLPSLRYFAHAGDKMPVSVAEKIMRQFPNKELYLMYGQTEASPRVSYLEPVHAKKKPSSVGKAIAPDIQIRIVNDSGATCAVGQEGEISVKGPNVMHGYWNAPEETSRVLKNGWLYTGDIGFMDKEGDLFVTGRKKYFLKIGGHRVNPLEIEAVTLEHDGVKEVAAIGIEDATWGQVLKVFVALSAESELKTSELMDFYKKRLPTFKVPAQIEIVPFLPKNNQGKIDKKSLELKGVSRGS